MQNLSDETIRQRLRPFGILVNDTVAERVRRYTELLLRWNRRVNLTSITDPAEILERHFGESFFAARAVPIERGSLVDVGSGAGFPGLALRTLLDGLRVTLIEPTTKKSVFLAEVCRELDLPDVDIFRGTLKEFSGSACFDYVTARALGRSEELRALGRGALRAGGWMIAWLGADDVGEFRADRSWTWREGIPIPLSKQRFLLVGQANPIE